MVRSQSASNHPDSSGANDYFYQAANFPLLLQAQLEVVAQALICNAAPIIGLMPMYATCDFDFGFAGAPGSHHTDLSHSGYQASPGAQYNSPISVSNLQAAARTPFATAQKWFTTQLVNKVVSLLATTDDPAAPGTKVLDNTIIFWMSEIGDGNDHNRVSEILYPQVPDSIPLVTIGGGAGALKTGHGGALPDRHQRQSGGRQSNGPGSADHAGQGDGRGVGVDAAHDRRPLRGAGVNARRAIGALLLAGVAACAGRGGGSPTGAAAARQRRHGHRRHGHRRPGPAAAAARGPAAAAPAPGAAATRTSRWPARRRTLGTPQLRLLTRTELQNSIDSAFPDVVGQWTASLPSNTISAHGFDNDASATIGGQLAGAVLDMGVSVGTAVTGSKLEHGPSLRRPTRPPSPPRTRARRRS